jgi:hypothetical protein
MTSQYERYFYWLGQLTSGDIYNPSGIDPAQQYSKIENPTTRMGKIGKYQMTENQMASLGYYILAEGDNGFANEWRGKWTGRRNIKSLEDFLDNHDTQELVIREAMQRHWRLIRRNGLDKLVGTKSRGVLLTESTLLAIAHLMGDEGIIASAPKSKALEKTDLSDLMYVCGYQTPYDINPQRDWVREEIKQYLRKGNAPTLNSDLSLIPRILVEQYAWCTQCDDKVRQSHAEREGEICQIGASPEPGEEENCRCFREDDISDPYNADIEKLALAIKRSCLSSSIKTHQDAEKFVKEHQGQLINNSYQCAALTHFLAPDLGPASTWQRGAIV